jgi:cellobiose phosphorylase
MPGIYIAITQWILGLCATYGALHIDPVIPQAWLDFETEYIFRDVT